jgi:hypothetical protein
MSQPTPELGPDTVLKQPTESPVQLWIRLWQAQLITHSR